MQSNPLAKHGLKSHQKIKEIQAITLVTSRRLQIQGMLEAPENNALCDLEHETPSELAELLLRLLVLRRNTLKRNHVRRGSSR